MKPQHWALLLIIAFGASVLGVGFLVTSARGRRPPGSAESYAGAGKRSLEPLFVAPEFDLPDHRGGRVSKASLTGRPWVANFIFTTCRSVCPMLTAKMVQLQRKLPDARIDFVSFSVDPEHDDVMALGAYAQAWAPQEKRWSLLATDAPSLPALLAGFRVTAEKNTTGQGADPIIHSSVFVLVDSQGMARGVYDSEHREEFLALVRDARSLAQAPQPTAAVVRSGAELYAQLSCGVCHDRAALAPPLGGLLGNKRELDTALVVSADERYLTESIIAPDAKRVAGYVLKMPTYDGVLAPGELEALVAYLKTLPEGAAAQAPHLAEDPICHMQVSVTPDALSAETDGGRVYFCSPSCRDRYVAGRAMSQ